MKTNSRQSKRPAEAKTSSNAKRMGDSRAAHGSAWVSVKDKLPMESEQVIAHYRGVYHRRLVIFWTDSGGSPHFGFQNEPDGKGSQPATHWHSLPELP